MLLVCIIAVDEQPGLLLDCVHYCFVVAPHCRVGCIYALFVCISFDLRIRHSHARCRRMGACLFRVCICLGT